MKDRYTIIENDEHLHIKGNGMITLEGDLFLLIKGNSYTEILGNRTTVIHGNDDLHIEGNLTEQIDQTSFTKADLHYTIQSERIDLNP